MIERGRKRDKEYRGGGSGTEGIMIERGRKGEIEYREGGGGG